MSYTYEYPHMAVTVDIVPVASGSRLEVLLIRRANPPFKDKWALPGGYVDIDERAEDAARRELREETGVTCGALEFVGYFDAVNRDPRERTLSLAFLARLGCDHPDIAAADDAADAAWFHVDDLPALAFDHAGVIEAALDCLSD